MTETRRTMRKWPLILIPCAFLALAIGIAALLCTVPPVPNTSGQTPSLWDRIFPPDPEDFDRRRGAPRSRHIKAYGIALRMYANDYETLPYSPDGTAAALYGLKDYLDTGDAAPQPPAFDDARRLLTNCPFEYLNTADLTLDNIPPMLVLLAEQQPDTNGGRWCLPADGHPRYIPAGKSCPVGKELDE